jgi:hypothetical protein
MNNSGIRSQLQLVKTCRDVACRVPTVVVGLQWDGIALLNCNFLTPTPTVVGTPPIC